ncbi:helix-turn-helix transcriptional regulator [Staphylococcus haemolyticus]|uniref:helix-turn-helix domain-containing protein n=1 Tax=Staphylococcus haemolyticus TaxID=1283 RepID=UPI001F15D1D0|nr:helix-turn-helix transcriptional regulator [Staphylococcus haemolyticus]MCE5021411.1 helix-turn-helix transcriptional regulator [Staphylococcus haemolyticus]
MRSIMIRPEDRMKIAQRINEIRLDANMLQSEFGKRLGVGRLAVCRWENRAQLPPMKTIRRMAEESNTTPEWILYGSDET